MLIFLKILLELFRITAINCEFGNFENHLLSGKLIIVTDGKCNNECMIVLNKISKITTEYYFTNIFRDEGAKNYMEYIKYSGNYPVYFFRTVFLSDIGHDPELVSILKDV